MGLRTLRGLCLALAAAMLLAAPTAGVAQDKAAREAQARAQRAINKLQQEKSALAREKDEQAAKLDAAGKEQSGLKAEASRARQRAAALDKELAALRKEHDEFKQRYDALSAQLAQNTTQCGEAQRAAQQSAQQAAEQTQKRYEAERSTSAALLRQERLTLQSCVAVNRKLHDLARDLARRYEKQARGAADPVFGLGLVDIENRMQDFRDKTDELKLAPPGRQ
jgi:chromosome segregation ATPase